MFLPEGTIVWDFTPGLDMELDPDYVETLPEQMQKFLDHFGYLDFHFNKYILCADNARFTNHSDEPNITADYERGKYGPDIATRDIEPGEEITADYSQFEKSEINRTRSHFATTGVKP